MHPLDINKINFLAGIECALRDICFTNFCDEDPIETCGEQYLLNFDPHEISLERQYAAQFFDALPMYCDDIHEKMLNGNQFEYCQDLAWQYIVCRFGLDDLGIDERIVDLVFRQFNGNTRSVFVGTDLDGEPRIFIE